MSDKDLIRRGDVRREIAKFISHNTSLVDEWAANCIDDIVDAIPAVPQEMSAREFGDAFRRYYFEDFLPNDTYDTEIDAYAYCFEITPVLIKKIEAWAREHPEERSEENA